MGWNGLKWIGYGVVYLGLFFVHSATFGQRGYHAGGIDTTLALTFGAIGLAVVVGGANIVRTAMITEQQELDRRAVNTLRRGAAAPDDTFSLFLRPFDIMGKLTIAQTSGGFFSWGQYERPGADALERLLADAVRPTSPLVGLGGREEIEFGLGTAGVILEWKKGIQRAMKEATYIFVVPSANEGTLWEVGEIKTGDYLQKAVFVMPPSIPPFKFTGAGEYKDIWEAARAACAREYQIKIPPYRPEGSLFLIDGTSAVREIPFRGFEPRQVAKTINLLMQS